MTRKTEWKGDAAAVSEKNSTKVAYTRDGIKFGMGFASDAFTGSVAGNLYEDGWLVNGVANCEKKPAKKEWKGKGALAVRSPIFSEKMRLWINVSERYNYNTAGRARRQARQDLDCHPQGQLQLRQLARRYGC